MNDVFCKITVRSRPGDDPVEIRRGCRFLTQPAQLPNPALVMNRRVYELYNGLGREIFGDAGIFPLDAVGLVQRNAFTPEKFHATLGDLKKVRCI